MSTQGTSDLSLWQAWLLMCVALLDDWLNWWCCFSFGASTISSSSLGVPFPFVGTVNSFSHQASLPPPIEIDDHGEFEVLGVQLGPRIIAMFTLLFIITLHLYSWFFIMYISNRLMIFLGYFFHTFMHFLFLVFSGVHMVQP